MCMFPSSKSTSLHSCCTADALCFTRYRTTLCKLLTIFFLRVFLLLFRPNEKSAVIIKVFTQSNEGNEQKDCSVPSVMDCWTMICDRKQRLVGFSFKMLSQWCCLLCMCNVFLQLSSKFSQQLATMTEAAVARETSGQCSCSVTLSVLNEAVILKLYGA